jgi:hypothetical protein
VAAAGQALDAREKAIRADVGAMLSDVNSKMSASVRAEVATQLPAQLDGVRSDLAAASKKLDTVAAQTARHEDVLSQHTATIAALPQDQANLKNDLRTALLGELDLRFAAANRAIDDRFTAFDKALTDRIGNLSADVKSAAADTARQIATDTASAQTKDLRTQLLAEMRAVAREEVGVIVRDNVNSAVNAAVKEQFAAVPGMIATEVRRVSATTVTPTTTTVVPSVVVKPSVAGKVISGGPQ